MMSLKQDCVSPNSNRPYILNITGGKDNSIEGLQVSALDINSAMKQTPPSLTWWSQHGITHAFVVQFANTKDRDYYVNFDPAHQAFKNSIHSILQKPIVVDFTNGRFE